MNINKDRITHERNIIEAYKVNGFVGVENYVGENYMELSKCFTDNEIKLFMFDEYYR